MKAIVAGATGLVGSFLIQKLLEDSRFTEVVAITRRPLEISHTKLRLVLLQDFSQISKESEQLRGDVYFCCLGTTIKVAGSKENFRKIDFDAIVEFGRLAQKSGAASFVLVSSMGANPQSFVFYNRIKGETEQALIDLGLKKLMIFQPGLLVGNRTEHRPGEKVALSIFMTLAPYLPNRLVKSMATEAQHLAARMIEEGLSPEPGLKRIPSVEI